MMDKVTPKLQDAAAKKDQYAKAVCLFLAEMLRTRKITLKRSSEISQKFLHNINLLDTEEQFLRLIKDMTPEFEELITLEQRVFLHMQIGERENLEAAVVEFVVHTLPVDLATATGVLQEAVNENCQLKDLMSKFPSFGEFMEQKNVGRSNT